jgi:LacI family transcriptional regulator
MARIPRIILLMESSRASGRALLKGVADYARYHGPWSFFWQPGGMEMTGPRLRSLDADGIIARDFLITPDQLRAARAAGIPVAVVGHRRREISGFINVVSDSRQIGHLAAEHLLQCGFKYFATCSYRRMPWAEQRRKFFSERVRSAGFSVGAYLTPPPDQIHWSKERKALVEWLISLPKPVGVMASNDDLGIQIMEACKLAALAVPEAVGVIGADNDELACGLADPAMSSVAINFERGGYQAAQAIDRRMRGKRAKLRSILVPASHMVARRSTDVVAVADAALARAMGFIRNRARGPMTVTEVAQAAGLSRRALERRFRREFKASIQGEIRRARTDQIARLLVETHLPINEIAAALKFPDGLHFSRYFRAGKNLSPLQYRRQFGSPTITAR